MILIDSNILIDVMDRDPVWYDWSISKMTDASREGRVLINHVIVAEVAPFAGDLNAFMSIIEPMGVDVENLCNEAAFAAGIAFRAYRHLRNDTDQKSILADFLIGGHAQALGATILTRDSRFYRAYFPQVPLMTPMKDEE